MPSIEIDTDGLTIKLTGDTESLAANRYAASYIKGYLGASVSTTGVVVPVPDGELEETISKVHRMLEKYGFAETTTSRTKGRLEAFYRDEQNFERFSQEALDIRNNTCDAAEFARFSQVLQTQLTKRSLYTRQLLAAYHLAFSQNACDFSVPGAGKTSIVYGAYAYLHSLPLDDPKRVDKLLVIGPLSSFGPWETECEECFGGKPDVQRVLGSLPREQRTRYFHSTRPCELTLMSYASLIAVRDDVVWFLQNNRVMVVLDEAHRIKNTTGGVTATAVLDIARNCRARAVLTGTPAPNGYEDLYNLFKFIWPTRNVIGFHVNQLHDMSQSEHDNRVQDMVVAISPYFMRITKKDLNLVPPVVHPPISVEMGPVQKRIYGFIAGQYVKDMMEDGDALSSSIRREMAKAKMMRLMQAATNPAMLVSSLESCVAPVGNDVLSQIARIGGGTSIAQDIGSYSQTETPAKFGATRELVDQLLQKGEKVIIWATFIQTILDLRVYLQIYGIDSRVLYGAIPVGQAFDGDDADESTELTREGIVREFQSHDCPYRVLIANPFAVGESISLHKACHNAIYVERTFNAAHFVQSKDRIHRYGLKPTDEINYYFVLAKGTIDETINKRLAEKETRMIEVMETMPIPLFDNASDDLGRDDIKAVIRDYSAGRNNGLS